MTREEAREAAEVMLAYAEGKEVELKVGNQWAAYTDDEEPDFNWFDYHYRIKPEPKYRPFKDAEECWDEMLKHQPFGWVKKINEETYLQVTKISGDNACIFRVNNVTYSAFDAHFLFDFADGTSFGVKEDAV